MKKLPLANYLPDVSALSYGCMGLGGGWNNQPISQEDVRQAHDVIDCALEHGINLFDHADIYTMGKAEQVFGEVLKSRPELREHIYLQSKCGIRFEDEGAPTRYDFSASWITSSVDNILSRLNIEYLDVLLLHRPDPLMDPAEVADTFHSLRQAGKVRHLGVSNMNGQHMTLLQNSLDAPLVANQIEISLNQLDWLDEVVLAGNTAGKDLNFTSGTLEYCRLNDVQIQAWSSLCRGLYSGRDVSNEAESVKRTADLVNKLAGEYQVSAEAIVLGFLTRHPAAIQPVIGTTNLDRIRACCDTVNVQLTREHWYSLYVSARGEKLP